MSDYDDFKEQYPEILAQAEAELQVTEEIARLRARIDELEDVIENLLYVIEKNEIYIDELESGVCIYKSIARKQAKRIPDLEKQKKSVCLQAACLQERI